MARWILIGCYLCLGLVNAQVKDVPKELTEYVQVARKSGLTAAQIQENALKAGWPADTVAAAIKSENQAGSPPANSPVSGPPASEAKPGSKDLPKDLVEYVQLARKAGLTPAQIQENALKGGWPADMVAAAIKSDNQAAGSSPANPPVAPTPAGGGKPGPPSTTGATPAPQAPAVPPGIAAPTPSGTPPASAGAPASLANPDEYVIGEGDVLGISVFGEPTASVGAVVVRPDGEITVPLLKDIAVAGLTPRQVEKIITDKLTDQIQAPNVTIVVSGINSKKIYLIGAVKREGPLAFTYPMTVLQALSEAGGLTDYAKRKRIYILRNDHGKAYRLPFDYDAVLRGERLELNIPLQAGDEIVVPH
jgi:polysaccharide biosynthesis/export protein